MKAIDLINLGSNSLKEKNIQSHILDSEILLSKTLNKSREEILINLNQKINENDILQFKKYLERRTKNELLLIFRGKRVLE